MPARRVDIPAEIKWCGKFCFDSKAHHHECDALIVDDDGVPYCYRYKWGLRRDLSGYAERCRELGMEEDS